MDEFATCSMNCQNKPVYACDCSIKNMFFCLSHIGPHGESNGNHHFTKIMKNPDPQTKIIISDYLKDLKLKTKQSKLRIAQESSLLIKKINETATKAFEKLLFFEKRLYEYIYLCDSLEEINSLNSKSFIESLLKLPVEDAEKIKYRYDRIINIKNDNLYGKIENLFNVYEAKSLFNIDNFSPKIKGFYGDNLFTFDVRSQYPITQKINKSCEGSPTTCVLNDGSLFCCFEKETFIIPPNNWIIPLPFCQSNQYSGLVAVDDFVYMFGGRGLESFKFSLKSNNWTKIAKYPVPTSYISCAYINNMILSAGHNSPIYIYNILNDSYTIASISLGSNGYKTCLATINKAYIIVHGKNSYESGLNNINSWSLIGSSNILFYDYPSCPYILLYEDCFYLITFDWNFIQFDLKNKQLKHLKKLYMQ